MDRLEEPLSWRLTVVDELGFDRELAVRVEQDGAPMYSVAQLRSDSFRLRSPRDLDVEDLPRHEIGDLLVEVVGRRDERRLDVPSRKDLLGLFHERAPGCLLLDRVHVVNLPAILLAGEGKRVESTPLFVLPCPPRGAVVLRIDDAGQRAAHCVAHCWWVRR